MKVCTDSCLFGAWVAKYLEENKISSKTILDIGTGTGLLSLMLAQKTNAMIEAIEINRSSYEQALSNFAESQWSSRLQAQDGDIKDYQTGIKYDLIISNPPFFENDLFSNDKEKNLAKHHVGLTLENLLSAVKRLVDSNGYFAVLLPYHRVENFIALARANGFFLQEIVLVKQSPKHTFFRGMLLFGLIDNALNQKEIIIRKEDQAYSNDFINLLGDYYLKL